MSKENSTLKKSVSICLAAFLLSCMVVLLTACGPVDSEVRADALYPDDSKPLSSSNDITYPDKSKSGYKYYGPEVIPNRLSPDYFNSIQYFIESGDPSNYTINNLFTLYRVIEVNDSEDRFIKVSPKLQGDVSESDCFDLHLDEKAAIYVNGQVAKVEDIKPNYLVSTYGGHKDGAESGVLDYSGTPKTLEDNSEFGVYFVNAWVTSN